MTNECLECRIAKRCHPERSEAVEGSQNYSLVFASGFLDFARNDAGRYVIRLHIARNFNLLRAEVRL